MTVPAPREPEPTPVTGGPRGHLRGHHIFWSLIAGLIIVAVAIAVSWLIARPADHDSWADVIRSAVLAAGAVAAVPAGYVAYRKQQTTEAERHEAIDKEQQRRNELVEANTRADAKDYRDRYAAAAGQLGNDKAAIRLAGVYALAHLADEWGRTEPAQRQVCIDVLCAYLRMPWPTPTAAIVTPRGAEYTSEPAPRSPTPREERQVRETILRVVAEHVRQDRDPETAWWANDFDLSGADPLPKCSFTAARFEGSFDARSVGFGSARFSGATFSDARFEGATFALLADFNRATFSQSARFAYAKFSRVLFKGARFSLFGDFDKATFSEAASFDGARFDHASFDGARFSLDALFDGAKFAGIISFEHPWYQETTVAGDVVRPDGTRDAATTLEAPRSLKNALFPEA